MLYRITSYTNGNHVVTEQEKRPYSRESSIPLENFVAKVHKYLGHNSYSAFALDLATTLSFLFLQVAEFTPSRVQYPDVDLLSSRDPARSRL